MTALAAFGVEYFFYIYFAACFSIVLFSNFACRHKIKLPLFPWQWNRQKRTIVHKDILYSAKWKLDL